MVEYKTEVNDGIIYLIEKSHKGFNSYNKLYELVKEKFGIKSKKTFDAHLRMLEKQKIIKKKKLEQEGRLKRTFISLHPNAIVRKRLGIFTIDYSDVKKLGKEKRKDMEKESEEKRKEKLILFLLLAMAYDYFGHKDIRRKPKPGDIAIPDPKIPNKFKNVSVYREKGFSPTDLIHNPNSTIIQTILQSHRFTKMEATDALKELQSVGIDIQTILSSDKKLVRYDIKDDMLKKFLLHCMMILDQLIVRMQHYYWFSQKRKFKNSKNSESNWYYMVFGEKVAINFFTKILDNNGKNKSDKDLWIEFYGLDKFLDNNPNLKIPIENFLPTIPIKEKVNELIQDQDRSIKKHLKFINTEEFPTIIEKKEQYPFLIDGIGKVIYPEFLRKQYKIKEELNEDEINKGIIPIFVI